MRAPDFFVLGAARCGTTSLYHYLGQHPDVLFSEPKEPTFFEAQFEKGLDYYWKRYFSHWKGEKRVGEARVYNLFLPYVPERILRVAPDARLIAILRNPVDRAFSLWWHRVTAGLESASFEEALAENRRRLRSGLDFEGEEGARRWAQGLYAGSNGTRFGTYLDGGYYAEQLERYHRHFPPAQMRVLFFEDLNRDPVGLTKELFEFLGLPPYPSLDTTPQNAARGERRSGAAQRLDQLSQLTGLGYLVPPLVRRLLKPWLRGRPVERPALAADTRRGLVEHFREPNRRLQRLLGRDLPGWDR